VFTEEDEMSATIELYVATVTYAKFERSVKKLKKSKTTSSSNNDDYSFNF
jgi:hypothetical protein